MLLLLQVIGPTAVEAAQLGGTVAFTDGNPDPIEDLTRRIAEKELDLFKLNTQFRLHYTKHNKWEERRLDLYNIAGSGVANAGVITLITQFWRYHNNVGLGLQRKGRLESGLIQVLVAYLIVGAGYTGEVLYDAYNDYRGKQKGFGAKEMCEKVKTLRIEIDDLLSQRDKLVANEASSRELLECEGTVLKDWRDLALLDFSSLYVQSREQHMVRELTNLGTMAVAYTGAFPGTLLALQGVQRVKLKEVGGSGIGFMTSAGILTLAPYLFKFGEVWQGHHCSRHMNEMLGEFQCHAAQRMQSDVEKLRGLIVANGGQKEAGVVSRHLKTYVAGGELAQERTDILEREKRATRRRFFDDVISYTARGGPQIAWSALLINAGYGNTLRPAVAFERVAQASTVNETSWGYWLLDYLQSGAHREISDFRHRKDPSFTDHAQRLNVLEAAMH